MSEATLHCPSPSRALTAGAIALAVISPALDPTEHAAEAVPPTKPVGPKSSEDIRIEERTTIAERASRAAPRRFSLSRAAAARARTNPFAAPDGGQALRDAVELAVADERVALRTAETQALVDVRDDLRGGEIVADEPAPASEALLSRADATARQLAAQRVRAERSAARAAAQQAAELVDDVTWTRPARNRVASRYQGAATRYQRAVTVRHAAAVQQGERVMRLGNGMNAVIAFARSQVGKRYVTGGSGPNGFDCSGFTKRAYALAGIRLPHSSGAQAARSRGVSRSQARPGDLVVGPGHVGIYMGRGMMIDAGNHRTGVVYRKVYNGLRVARIS
ncbi:C40 family peptidase [Paractinoplanes ovalisporus]|uniref:C40 family peptidase n=1 Tax=Paractinoplanes ovalisporus TaxID=2810368 RepID=UPI001F443BC8|nr:C40 family peptidase [Actinoplanes ovalisporus]